MNDQQTYDDIAYLLTKEGIPCEKISSIGHMPPRTVSIEVMGNGVLLEEQSRKLKQMLSGYPVFITTGKDRLIIQSK